MSWWGGLTLFGFGGIRSIHVLLSSLLSSRSRSTIAHQTCIVPSLFSQPVSTTLTDTKRREEKRREEKRERKRKKEKERLKTMSMSMMLSTCASPFLRLPLRNRPNNIATSSSFFKDPTTTTRRRAAAAAATPLKLVLKKKNPKKKMAGAVCSGVSFSSPQTLQWLSAVSSAVLMLVNGTAIQKSFLVPLFALQAPSGVISWIKGEYGIWIAFVALLVRLFYFIPGQLDLPFLTMLLVIVAPYQSMDLRGSQAGAIISFAIAGYLTFQHFSRAGSLRRAFDQGSIIATIAVICIAAVSFFFLF